MAGKSGSVDFLSAEQRDEYRGVFGLFDAENRGYIDFDTLKSAMIAMRLHPKDADVKKMIAEADVTGSGKVDFTSFVGVMTRKLGKMDSEAEILRAFNTFDRQDRGVLPQEELRKALTSLGDKLSDSEWRVIFGDKAVKERCEDDAGNFDYEKFTKIVVGKEIIHGAESS